MKGRSAASLFEDDGLAELALTSPKGLFIAATHVGHLVHRDDPMLVVRLVEHIRLTKQSRDSVRTESAPQHV